MRLILFVLFTGVRGVSKLGYLLCDGKKLSILKLQIWNCRKHPLFHPGFLCHLECGFVLHSPPLKWKNYFCAFGRRIWCLMKMFISLILKSRNENLVWLEVMLESIFCLALSMICLSTIIWMMELICT